jgi:hypothetical protein
MPLVVRQQQGRAFVAGLAKKRLSSCHGFGIMRMASQKNTGKFSKESGGARTPHEVFKESALARPHLNKGDF